MEDLNARRMRTLHVRRRITPEEGEDGYSFFQADSNLILDGKVEEQVHPERFGGERPHAADLLAKTLRRVELSLQDAEAAGIAHRRDEIRARQVRPHRCRENRMFDAQCVAQRGFHEHSSGLAIPNLFVSLRLTPSRDDVVLRDRLPRWVAVEPLGRAAAIIRISRMFEIDLA